jgi:ubiquinol-cytochrome c reductase cytochrome b subunit
MSRSAKFLSWLECRLNLSEIFSFITTFGISYIPVNTCMPLQDVTQDAFLTPIPSYQRWPHIFGILTFVTFLLEVITGLLLAFYYQPAVAMAYQSTRFIIRDSSFGWYIHQMHHWGAQLLVVLLAVRLARFLWHRVYRAPRELMWIFGVILFLLAVQSTFTGKLLPWDQNGYWTTIRGLELMGRIPFFGGLLSGFVGGFNPNDALLLRFYLLHIIFLPLLIFVFFYLHFATVRRVGLSSVPNVSDNPAPIYPAHLMNLLIILLVIFGGILTLAMIVPDQFSAQANPFSTPHGIPVAWYLLPLYGLFEMVPSWLASWIAFASVWLLLFIPFLDRAGDQPARKRAVMLTSLILFSAALYLAYFGYSRRG